MFVSGPILCIRPLVGLQSRPRVLDSRVRAVFPSLLLPMWCVGAVLFSALVFMLWLSVLPLLSYQVSPRVTTTLRIIPAVPSPVSAVSFPPPAPAFSHLNGPGVTRGHAPHDWNPLYPFDKVCTVCRLAHRHNVPSSP